MKTGTKYSTELFDIHGFSPYGLHQKTGLRYNDRFFRIDRETNSWINLHTGKDEDLLGYNHSGIRVNQEHGRVGFDRYGLWHKKLENGAYSVIGEEYDDEGYNVYGFNAKGKAKDGTNYVNKFYVRFRDGLPEYIHLDTQRTFDPEGYNIEGFNRFGFNRQGIHENTGTKFNESGVFIDEYNAAKAIQGYEIVSAISSSEKNQTQITEFLIYLKTTQKNVHILDWYRPVTKRINGIRRSNLECEDLDLEEAINELCDEAYIAECIKAKEKINRSIFLNEKIEKESARNTRLRQIRDKNTVDIYKLKNILKGNWTPVKEDKDVVK